jgi:hypothetical protein
MSSRRAFDGDRLTTLPEVQRCLTKRYDATSRIVNVETASNWYGNSGIPPPPELVVVVGLVLEVVVWVGVVVNVVVLVELDVVELV